MRSAGCHNRGESEIPIASKQRVRPCFDRQGRHHQKWQDEVSVPLAKRTVRILQKMHSCLNSLLLLFAGKYSLVSCSVDNVVQEQMVGIWLVEHVDKDNQPNKRQKSVLKKEPFTLQ